FPAGFAGRRRGGTGSPARRSADGQRDGRGEPAAVGDDDVFRAGGEHSGLVGRIGIQLPQDRAVGADEGRGEVVEAEEVAAGNLDRRAGPGGAGRQLEDPGVEPLRGGRAATPRRTAPGRQAEAERAEEVGGEELAVGGVRRHRRRDGRRGRRGRSAGRGGGTHGGGGGTRRRPGRRRRQRQRPEERVDRRRGLRAGGGRRPRRTDDGRRGGAGRWRHRVSGSGRRDAGRADWGGPGLQRLLVADGGAPAPARADDPGRHQDGDAGHGRRRTGQTVPDPGQARNGSYPAEERDLGQ